MADPPLGPGQGREGWAYLAVRVLAGSNVALDVGNGIGWARQQRGASVNDGLAAPIASDDLAVHGDAEGEMQARVSLAPGAHLPEEEPSDSRRPLFPTHRTIHKISASLIPGLGGTVLVLGLQILASRETAPAWADLGDRSPSQAGQGKDSWGVRLHGGLAGPEDEGGTGWPETTSQPFCPISRLKATFS